MSRITAVLLFLEILRRTTAIAVDEEEIREIYYRQFITHPDGGPICSSSTDVYNSAELLLPGLSVRRLAFKGAPGGMPSRGLPEDVAHIKRTAMRAQLKRELLRTLLVGPAYMPQILDRLRERGFVRASGVSSEMRELERKGLVASVPCEEVSARIGRPRIYYELTDKGRREALEVRRQ
jgi:hypothetical protein